MAKLPHRPSHHLPQRHPDQLPYLSAYPDTLRTQVASLIEAGKLGEVLVQRYPDAHGIRTDKALYAYVQDLKADCLRQADPVSKVAYDSKIHVVRHALGLHTAISRVQGNRLKAKHEIRIASVFRDTPLPFLRMIAVHELAHLKEKEHDKAFYKLCCWMEPHYHQLEFDLRLYLTWLDLGGKRLWAGPEEFVAV
ncbi:YgjP-like metallopeptidase domain-containing protein [Massilia consociata]|uniref:YgjP-like metallopeptidase domain-containing protein n=1 Tax=Massilia consociata TaxID=760117 RepID=A0ABV6FGF4_9BURK